MGSKLNDFVSCNKGAMKWTHRFMMIGFLLFLIGMCLILYTVLYDTNNLNMLYTGIALCVFFVLIWFVCMINAYIKGCYKTAYAISFLSPIY